MFSNSLPTNSLPILHTPRLTLRPLTAADADAVYRMVDSSRDSFSRWFQWAGAGTRDSSEDNLRQAEQAMLVGSAWHYAALTRASSLVARMGLTQIDLVNLSAELGYMLRADFEGRGLMTEAIYGLLSHAFGPGGLHRITAYADVENVPSHRVLARLGFRREGTVRHALRHPERGWRDHHVYGLLKGELTNGK